MGARLDGLPYRFNPAGRYTEPRGGRLNAPGQLLARGPLDYDVPVLRRCVDCHGVYAEPLAGDGGCPHCQRTLDLGGAA